MDLNRLNSCLSQGKWDEADALLAPVTQGADAHPSLLYNHGKVLIEMGRFGAAQALLERCTELAPDHAAAWFEMARAALAGEDFSTAFDGFARALALDPYDTDARCNLGRVALRTGRYKIAQEAWKEFAGDPEADLALYRVAAETGAPEAAEMRKELLATHPNRAAVIKTLVRVSKGAIPLNL
jgi:tetratricopeptide (TPR) repeat protein